jgi:signal transduction histidine kinase/CheY-like chemotaxis protein
MIPVALAVGVLLLGSVYTVCTYMEKKEAAAVMEDTLEFMRIQCLRYDNLSASLETRDAIQLLDKTKELSRCLAQPGDWDQTDFLSDYADAQRISGILLMDGQGNVTDNISKDTENALDWQEILQDENVTNVMDYPKKSYMSHVRMEDGTDYDYAVVANEDGNGLIFCYVRQAASVADENQIDIGNLLDGYRLEMDGLILITDGETILSSNDSSLPGMQVSDESLIADHIEEIPADSIGKVQDGDTAYMAQCSKCRTYYLYAFFPARSVYRSRIVVLAYVLVFYVLCLLILSMLRQRELKNSNQMKLEFLRRVSHDIRTPVNGIRGMLRIGDSFPDDMEKQRECREKIWEASGFLEALINDVMEMSQLEVGEVRLEKKPFDLYELLDKTVSSMELQAREQGVELAFSSFEGTHRRLVGSPIQVRRILVNLISNGVKYNRENGTVSVSCRELSQSGEGSPDRVSYEIVCQDSGIGMSTEFQKQMFNQFTQENASGEQSHHGTGLGLAIVKSLVTQMGGEIRCESKPGEGTAFYVTLPFGVDHSAPVDEAPVEPEPAEEDGLPLQDVRILLVEDNDLNMEIAEFVLTEKGAAVTPAWNGQEAVDAFAKSKPGEYQVILMDMMMPVMDGVTATRRIRAMGRPDARTIPIIAVTANVFDSDVQAAKEAGMDAHFAKPIDPDRLQMVIRRYVR